MAFLVRLVGTLWLWEQLLPVGEAEAVTATVALMVDQVAVVGVVLPLE